MRLVTTATFVALIALATLLRAQEAVDVPAKQTARAMPARTPTTEPTIPPNLPDVSQLDALFKQSSLGRAADQLRLHTEWRRLRNQITNLPDVVAAKKAADAARTDLEKRQLLRRYYEICYAHMQALAREPDVKVGLQAMKAEHLKTLDQPRVRPSASPAPTPTSESAAPSPTPLPSPSSTPEPESESSQ